MRKLFLLGLALCAMFAIQAQTDVPYSKYLNFGKDEFK